MEQINKKRALEIMSQAADIYNDVFNRKNLLIIYGNPCSPKYIITESYPQNFLHLTGVVLNTNIPNNTAEKFLEKVLNDRLGVNEFSLKESSSQKLEVLIQTLSIKSTARMIGDFSGNRVNLKTDKLAGGTSSFLGFIKVGENYVPNTVIKGDIRKDALFTERVLGVLSKRITEPQYNERIYIAKKIDAERLFKAVSKDVPVAIEMITN